MTWASPLLFLFLIPLLFVGAYILRRRKSSRASLRWGSLREFKMVPRGFRAQLAGMPFGLQFLSLVLVVLALARPQTSTTKIKRNVEGIDIMLTLDISDSMLIEDMAPINRMESAKQTIIDFIKGRVSDRIGLVVFSGEAYTRTPLTLDYELLLGTVKDVQPTRNIKMGTAIGVALANSVTRLKDSTAKTRVVILLTDGENNSGTIAPETALDIAKGYGIRIYTIGIGRDGDAQLPVTTTDVFGRKVKTYQPIHSAVNDSLLGLMAEQTGGKYFRATHTKALEGVFREIDRLEKTKVDIHRYTRYTEHFQDFVLWALVFYTAALILGQTWLRRAP